MAHFNISFRLRSIRCLHVDGFQVPHRLMTCVTRGDNFNHTIRQIQLPSEPFSIISLNNSVAVHSFCIYVQALTFMQCPIIRVQELCYHEKLNSKEPLALSRHRVCCMSNRFDRLWQLLKNIDRHAVIANIFDIKMNVRCNLSVLIFFHVYVACNTLTSFRLIRS